jgi:hypothetical protein
MRLYKPNPTFGEPPNRSGGSDGKGCPKLHCPWGSHVSEPQDSVRGLLRKKERRWTLHKVACLRRCGRRERRGRKDPEFHTPHDARPQTPVDVARDGTAIMIHGSEGRARSCGGGLGCLCFFTLRGAAVVPRRGRFRGWAGEAPASTTTAAREYGPWHPKVGWLTVQPRSAAIKTAPRDRPAIAGMIVPKWEGQDL